MFCPHVSEYYRKKDYDQFRPFSKEGCGCGLSLSHTHTHTHTLGCGWVNMDEGVGCIIFTPTLSTAIIMACITFV